MCDRLWRCSQTSLVRAKLIRELILSDPERKFNSKENVKEILKACQGCGSSLGFLSLFCLLIYRYLNFLSINYFISRKSFSVCVYFM